MFTRITMRWAVVSIMAVTALAAISLMLNPASRTQAAPSFEFTWPSLLPPCNSTLQACVDLTNDGDQITILPGSYTTASITIRRSITVTSLLLQTTLQAPPGQRVITVTSLPTDVLGAQVHLINLTLTSGNVVTPNGQCPDHCGGGVLVTDRAHVWLDNVIIARNQAFRGGGVYVDRGSVTLNGGQITSNSAVDPGQILGGSGGGVYVAGALSIFEQNGGVIDANLATDGAGVFVQDCG